MKTGFYNLPCISKWPRGIVLAIGLYKEVSKGEKGRRSCLIKSRGLCVPPPSFLLEWKDHAVTIITKVTHYGQRTDEMGALVLDDFMKSYPGLST